VANVTQARRSTVALKSAMAVSGLIMVVYLVAHMYGNLKVFNGREAFNTYAEHLRTMGEPILPHAGALWVIRVVLTASVIIHAYTAVALWRRNRASAGYVGAKRYQTTRNRLGIQRSYASFTMRWGGVTILLFIIFHLLNLTTDDIHPGGASPSPYDRVINSFGVWWVVLAYTISLLAVGFHLWHGAWSAFTTLGGNHSSTRRASNLNNLAIAISVILTVGFLLPPWAILFGWVG